MRETLSSLHHAHDGGVHLLLTILEDAFHGLFVLLGGFLDLNRVHLDAEETLVERRVDFKDVVVVDVARFRFLVEDSNLGAREGLERTFQFFFLEPARLGDFLVRQLLGAVEEQEHDALEERDAQLLQAAPETRLEHAVSLGVLPRQFPTGVLAEIKVLKLILQVFELIGNIHRDGRVRGPASRGEHVDAHVDALHVGVVLIALSESLHHLVTEIDVFEHSLQVRRELTSTLRLELANHALLGVDARALAVQETLGEFPLVKSFKHILADDVSEQRQRFV